MARSCPPGGFNRFAELDLSGQFSRPRPVFERIAVNSNPPRKTMAPGVFVVSAARTAVGGFGGALKDVGLAQLATTAIKGAIAQAKVPAEAIGTVYMGGKRHEAYLETFSF